MVARVFGLFLVFFCFLDSAIDCKEHEGSVKIFEFDSFRETLLIFIFSIQECTRGVSAIKLHYSP